MYEAPHGVRAVSRNHALNKGLKVVQTWNSYRDRVDHPDWTVDASVSFAEAI